ncbi:hypothetical protein K370107A2_15420 [Merdimmobilis hominis]|uniref:hypothetical protein n=1 Tax=Merdimmobilis hominis TaxID=2897707 RepID=UPI0034BE42DC
MAIKWKQDSVKAIREKQAAEVRAEAMNTQAQTAARAFRAASMSAALPAVYWWCALWDGTWQIATNFKSSFITNSFSQPRE